MCSDNTAMPYTVASAVEIPGPLRVVRSSTGLPWAAVTQITQTEQTTQNTCQHFTQDQT